MFPFLRLQLHLPSFLVGLVLASLFWWLAISFRRSWPRLRGEIRHKIQEYRERNLSGLEAYIRQETINRAQRQHLASGLFSLDEILLEPYLLAPPPAPGLESTPTSSITQQLIPYLPDFPILASQYAVPRLKIEEALQYGANIAIIGQPGAGKSVALADFACRLARRQISTNLATRMPLYFHIIDLLPEEASAPDPFDLLQKALLRHLPVLYQRQVGQFLTSILTEGRALLIVDGLDTLPSQQLVQASTFFKLLLRSFPRVQFVLAAAPEALVGLTSIGIYPLTLETWTSADVEQFIQKWSSVWDRGIAPQLNHLNRSYMIDPRLVIGWLSAETSHYSPLEWTLRTWAMFSGDLTGGQPSQWIDAYLNRILQGKVPVEAAVTVASRLLQGQVAFYSYSQLEKHLSTFQLSQAAENSAVIPGLPKSSGKSKSSTAVTSGSRILDLLLDAELLARYGADRVTFSQPVLCGYLASLADDVEAALQPDLGEIPTWSFFNSYLRYRLAANKVDSWREHLLDQQPSPFLASQLLVGRWLCDIPTSLSWRNRFLRQLVQMLQDDSMTRSVRARIIATFVAANDPATGTLFRQLLSSPSAILRQLAATGSGAIRDPKAAQDLLALLNDPVAEVRYSAALALTNLDVALGNQELSSALNGPDEAIRMVVIETLAANQSIGPDILNELSVSEDLVVRRASVSGLALINEEWSRALLQKMAIEDGQWVVRNAAAQAIESFDSENPYSPRPKVRPSEAGWLIQFASRQGKSVSREESPVPMLLQALLDGNREEKLGAMEYLCRVQDEEVVPHLFDLFYSEDLEMSDAAGYALWLMSVGGMTLPSPQEYGLS